MYGNQAYGTQEYAGLEGARNFSSTLTESIKIAGAISKKSVRTIANLIKLSDAISKIGTFKKTITEALKISDAISKIGTFYKTITDTIKLTNNYAFRS